MANTFETITIDNTGITALELLKLARETQLKIASKASTLYFKNQNKPGFKTAFQREQTKLDYIEYKIKELERETD